MSSLPACLPGINLFPTGQVLGEETPRCQRAEVGKLKSNGKVEWREDPNEVVATFADKTALSPTKKVDALPVKALTTVSLHVLLL